MGRLESMDTFIRVVEAGSISGAAERMGVAKSAVSRRLKELEAHLGVSLFNRTTRKMNLTDTGQSFYEQSLRILADVLEAELATSQIHSELKGRLKVALPLSFGLMHLGPALNNFLQLHASIEFDLSFSDREVDLMQEGFDVAIRIGQLMDSTLIARKIVPIRAVMCASPNYLKRMGIPQTLGELIRHQCLVYSLMRDFENWHLQDTAGKLHTVKIQPFLKASNGEFLRDAAIKGLGIVMLPSFISYKALESGALVPILPEYSRANLNAYVIYPQTRHLSQRVRALVDYLVEYFSGTPYWDECLKSK
ncbi:MAG: LysR family transcriptional regulator [Thiomicrorhabdus sp.]|nr:LysR family transcriptional regulator [Thiomicrorhabdus sp.]